MQADEEEDADNPFEFEDGDYNDPNEPDHPDYLVKQLINLDLMQNAEDFYLVAGTLVFRAHELTRDQLNFLADRISKPWRRAPGAPQKRSRNLQIWFRYFADRSQAPKPSRSEAIAEIARGFRMTTGAAAKVYDTLSKAREEELFAPPETKKRKPLSERALKLLNALNKMAKKKAG